MSSTTTRPSPVTSAVQSDWHPNSESTISTSPTSIAPFALRSSRSGEPSQPFVGVKQGSWLLRRSCTPCRLGNRPPPTGCTPRRRRRRRCIFVAGVILDGELTTRLPRLQQGCSCMQRVVVRHGSHARPVVHRGRRIVVRGGRIGATGNRSSPSRNQGSRSRRTRHLPRGLLRPTTIQSCPGRIHNKCRRRSCR